MIKEELEKEADEYATENYEQCIYDDVIGWKTDYEARKQAYLAGAEPREKRIAELEKKNAELKEGHKQNEIDLIIRNSSARAELNDQLAQAKDLLTRFVMASVYFNGKEADLVEEAEQFLKGEA